MPALRLSKRQTIFPALLLLAAAVLLRCQVFNDPIFYIDEDFYLYVGRELLNGYLPYVDVWDRKPFGLFLLYAPFALFGEYRFLASQLGALAFAWGTSLFILKITQRFASTCTASLTAIFYVALIGCLRGSGGQAAIFYNFFTAFAFYLVITHLQQMKLSTKSLTRTGCEAMLLIGIAIEIKPTVIFEGIFLGCFLLFLLWHSQKKIQALCLNGIFWILASLLPTLLVIGFYLKIGQFDAWYFANILSIFHKDAYTPLARLYPYLALFAAFLLALILLRYTAVHKFRTEERKYFYFLLCWTIVSLVASGLIRPFYSFYLLPFCLPLTLFIGLASSKNKIAQSLLILGLAGTALVSQYLIFQIKQIHPEAEYYQIQKQVSAAPSGCLFEYGAIVTLLDPVPEMVKNCHLTKYLFPSHLGNPDEEGSLGLENEIAELKHILDQKPSFILVGQYYLQADKYKKFLNKASSFREKNEILKTRLNQNYHLTYKHLKDEPLELYEINKTS
ncbi:hypothetical protein FAI41_03455 [Acetobacteraceae bacterium]|nr:hypothetical protein FAI41_03455 [Acetobacteraceae bacterium]